MYCQISHSILYILTGHLTLDLRMLQSMRVHSSRLMWQINSDKHKCRRCRKQPIAHMSRMLSERWTRFRVVSGILKKKRKGESPVTDSCYRKCR